MKINPLSYNNYYSKDFAGKASESKEQSNVNPKVQDKLELSAEAKKIQNSQPNGKDLEAIKAKIDNNFYNSPDVLNKVADKILKELS